MPRLDISDILCAAESAHKDTRRLFGVLASIQEICKNPPLKIEAATDLVINRDLAPAISVKSDAKIFGRKLGGAQRSTKRTGRGGHERPC